MIAKCILTIMLLITNMPAYDHTQSSGYNTAHIVLNNKTLKYNPGNFELDKVDKKDIITLEFYVKYLSIYYDTLYRDIQELNGVHLKRDNEMYYECVVTARLLDFMDLPEVPKYADNEKMSDNVRKLVNHINALRNEIKSQNNLIENAKDILKKCTTDNPLHLNQE